MLFDITTPMNFKLTPLSRVKTAFVAHALVERLVSDYGCYLVVEIFGETESFVLEVTDAGMRQIPKLTFGRKSGAAHSSAHQLCTIANFNQATPLSEKING